MILHIFLFIFFSIPLFINAMEEQPCNQGMKNDSSVSKLTQITAKKIYEYQQGNRNVKKTIKVLQALPDMAARHIAQQKDGVGNTLLHTAAYLGNKEMIEYLLEICVEKRPRNKWKETPLMVAAKQGHLDCYELLYTPEDSEEPADSERLMKFVLAIPGKKALQCAANIEEAFKPEMISSLCAGGDIDYLKSSLKAFKGGGRPVKKGFLNAIRAGSIEHIQILFEDDEIHGWLTKIGRFKAVYEATLCGQVAAAQLLLSHGLQCDEALHCAVRNDNKKLAKIYCKKFPEQLNSLDSSKKTPLYYASIYGFVSLVNFLFKKGATPNVDGLEQSVLYDALCVSKNYTIVRSLLERGARILDDEIELDVLNEMIEANEFQLVSLLLPYCKQACISILFSREQIIKFKRLTEEMKQLLNSYFDEQEMQNCSL